MNKPNSPLDAAALLEGLRRDLQGLPIYDRGQWTPEPSHQADHGLDALGTFYLQGSDQPIRWGVEIKSRSLEPREAELQGARLAELREGQGLDGVLILAPYVSGAAAAILERRGIGYWDASGNCRIWSGALYIERTGFPNRFARQPSHGSPFTRAGQRLLRPLLDPEHIGRRWTLRELALAAHPAISLGQAHALAKVLENGNHLARNPEGIKVLNPERLLRAWASEAKAPRLTQRSFYSSLSQDAFRKRFEEVLPNLESNCKAVLASFTAASELAPFVRQHRSFFYWSGDPVSLQQALDLQTVPDGENVVGYLAPDEGVFYGWEPGKPPVTCPVQTFIDLIRAGGRGEEAAEQLFDRILKSRYSA